MRRRRLRIVQRKMRTMNHRDRGISLLRVDKQRLDLSVESRASQCKERKYGDDAGKMRTQTDSSHRIHLTESFPPLLNRVFAAAQLKLRSKR